MSSYPSTLTRERAPNTIRYCLYYPNRRRGFLASFIGVLLVCTLNGAEALLGIERQTTRRSLSVQMVLTTPESIIEQASTTKLLDDLIDESVRITARRPIMMQFDPSSGLLWRRWKGTIFSETWDSCVTKMVYASVVFLACRRFPQVKDALLGFNVLWGQLLSVTTFTLTFFVNQSYSLWRKCISLSRRLQGRLHDLDMSISAHAVRTQPSSPNEPSRYTPGSRQVLELVSRYVRLFNLLTYASFTRSHRPMLTPAGMRRLVDRGLMTPMEREVLVDAQIPATQRHNAVLLWIIRSFIEGCEAGHFKGGSGFEQQFLEKAHVCRSCYGAIGDELQGRMPLAYAHIVQVLVDLVLWMYPFMAYSSGMSGFLCVLGTGLLTIGYQGLFDLAKQFLDPYDNENYGRGEDPLVVDTLIAETNAGSIRWMNGLDEYPVSSQRIQDGDLTDILLPVKGYSVEELMKKEEEKRELQEQREREELERQRMEAEEAMVREAAEAMVSYQVNETVTPVFNASKQKIAVANDFGGAMNISSCVLCVEPYASVEVLNSVLYSQNYDATSLQEALVPQGTSPASMYIEEAHGSGTKRNEASSESDVAEAAVATEINGKDNERREDEASKTLSDEKFPAITSGTQKGALPDTLDPSLPNPTLIPEQIASDYYERFQELDPEEARELLFAGALLAASATTDQMKNVSEKRSQAATTENGATQQKSSKQIVVPPASVDSIAQIWDPTMKFESSHEATTPSSTPDYDYLEPPQFWDEWIYDDISFDSTGASAPLDDSSLDREDGVVDRTEEVDSPEKSGPITFEDYTRKAQDILDAERNELLETEAILNAPPGAHHIVNATETLAEDEEDVPVVPESFHNEQEVESNDEIDDTNMVDDSVTDGPPEETVLTPDLQEELLETEAILNAPPGADVIAILEEDEIDKISRLSNTTKAEDDLAALEMDEPELDEEESKQESCETKESVVVGAEPSEATIIPNGETTEVLASDSLPKGDKRKQRLEDPSSPDPDLAP